MHEINLYQTHLTEGQWSYINKEFLENDSRKRKYSLQSVFEAILYLLVSGCQWRRLPHDYPKWKSVYYYYYKWRQEGRVEHFCKNLSEKYGSRRGQASSPTVGALDSQSVKWGSRQEITDTMATRRSRVSKGISLPTATASSLQERSAMQGSTIQKWLMNYADWQMMSGKACARYCPIAGIVEMWPKTLKKTSALNLRCPILLMESKGFLPKPLRWVVERTFAWLDSCRRLARNYETTNESAEEMIDFAAIKFLITKI